MAKRSNKTWKAVERELCQILIDRFPGLKFCRVIGSGNRWAQADVPEHSRATVTGDLVCPEGFRFAIECKFGYEDIDLFSAIIQGNKQLDDHLLQAKTDAARLGREPLLCWKRRRRGWLCFVLSSPRMVVLPESYPCIFYKTWVGFSLDNLLKEADELFFQIPPPSLEKPNAPT
jgi:hypothetical protein